MNIFQIFSLLPTHTFTPHTISFTCGIVLLYFKGLVRGPLDNALMIKHRGPEINTNIGHCRAGEDAFDFKAEVLKRWGIIEPQTLRDQQEPEVQNDLHSALFQERRWRSMPSCVFGSSFLSSTCSCSLPCHRDCAFRMQHQLQLGESPCPELKHEPSTPGFWIPSRGCSLQPNTTLRQ